MIKAKRYEEVWGLGKRWDTRQEGSRSHGSFRVFEPGQLGTMGIISRDKLCWREFKPGHVEPESSGSCLKGSAQQTVNLEEFETSLSGDTI